MKKAPPKRMSRRNGTRPAAIVGTVLIFAYDLRPIVEREQILAQNGYEVVACASFSSALALVRKRGLEYDFLVIGYAVPEQERLRLAQAYRRAHRAGQVIFLYRTAIKNTSPPVAALLSIHGADDNLLTAIRSVTPVPTTAATAANGGKHGTSAKGGGK